MYLVRTARARPLSGGGLVFPGPPWPPDGGVGLGHVRETGDLKSKQADTVRSLEWQIVEEKDISFGCPATGRAEVLVSERLDAGIAPRFLDQLSATIPAGSTRPWCGTGPAVIRPARRGCQRT